MIKKKYLFLIIALLIVLVIDYLFFYKKILNYNKIIDCCIQIEGISRNTFSNAVESLKWVKSKKINSFVLLTNNYHMPRAMLEFKSIFNDISITPYAFVDENKKWWKTKINYISEYFKYKLTYLRIHLLQF